MVDVNHMCKTPPVQHLDSCLNDQLGMIAWPSGHIKLTITVSKAGVCSQAEGKKSSIWRWITVYGEDAGGEVSLLTSAPLFCDWEGMKDTFLSWDA